MERLDKIISHAFSLSRTDAKKAIKSGEVCVDGEVIKDVSFKTDYSAVTLEGKKADYDEHIYIMLNKPAGVVSASESKSEKTVIDLVPEHLKRKGLFPAGRLDKDTVGFVLITDDGAFAHDILSPKKHIEKTYFLRTDKPIPLTLEKQFKEGVILYDGTECMSAYLKIDKNNPNEAIVKIREGKYHQIKRMFRVNSLSVEYLKRTAMGNLELDESLKEGECRKLNKEETNKIKDK